MLTKFKRELIIPFKLEFDLLIRNKNRWLQPLLFFFMLIILFPIGLGHAQATSPLLWPTLIWMSASLAILWSSESIFQFELEHGAIEQIILSPYPLWLWLMIKGLAYWMIIGLSLSILGPLLAMIMGLPKTASLTLGVSLLIGTPGLCLMSIAASSIILSIKNNGLLLILMMLPLYIPFLILGVGSVNMSLMQLSPTAQLAWLGAFTILIALLAPVIGAQGIKFSLDN